ncbi:MAG: hypothetical protein V4717_12075 [Bacteroidota bacterium]
MKENKLPLKCLPAARRLSLGVCLVVLIARLTPARSNAKYVEPVFHCHEISWAVD